VCDAIVVATEACFGVANCDKESERMKRRACEAAEAPPAIVRSQANAATAATAAVAAAAGTGQREGREGGGELDDRHRRLLQLFVARKVLTQRELEDAVAGLDQDGPQRGGGGSNERQRNGARAQEMIGRINGRLGPCARLEIRRMQCEVPALETFWGIADSGCTAAAGGGEKGGEGGRGGELKADEASLCGTPFTPEEVAHFRTLLETIVLGEIDRDDNDDGDGVGITRAQARAKAADPSSADAMWTKFVCDGWLRLLPFHGDRDRRRSSSSSSGGGGAQHNRRHIRSVNVDTDSDDGGGDGDGNSDDEQRAILGPRALIELRPYMEQRFGEQLPRCVICQEIALLAERCPNGRCDVRLHRECMRRLFEHNPRRICPQCSAAWHPRR